ncbi:MAG: Fur family transcriptional regulator [Planctomycetota bacterium]
MSTQNEVKLNPSPVSLSPEQRFEDYLQSRGMRNTEQRRSLIRVVFSEHEHFDADQLIERLPLRGDEGYVSRPTVYRTLSEFVDAGLLKKFDLDGRSVYEHDYGYPQHDHFYCNRCHQLIEFQDEALSKKIDEIAAEHRFQKRSHRLLITGVCNECRQSRQRKRRRVDRI